MFKIGDQVEVIDQTGAVLSTRTVVRADDREAVTKCGRHWRQADGYWIGGMDAWPFPFIRAAQSDGPATATSPQDKA